MRLNKPTYLILLLIFSACGSEINQSHSDDTTKIVAEILRNVVKTENLNVAIDSVYIIKSGVMSNLKQIPGFQVGYLEATKQEDLIDLSPASFNDQRVRITIGKFSIHGDTASAKVGVNQLQQFSIYDIMLFHKKKAWQVQRFGKTEY